MNERLELLMEAKELPEEDHKELREFSDFLGRLKEEREREITGTWTVARSTRITLRSDLRCPCQIQFQDINVKNPLVPFLDETHTKQIGWAQQSSTDPRVFDIFFDPIRMNQILRSEPVNLRLPNPPEQTHAKEESVCGDTSA